MLAFHAWSERQAHLVRWLLLGAWLLLIASMLRPGAAAAVTAMRLFWQLGVPLVLLVLVVFSHEAWRRLCPLAFVSQLPRALGRQRQVMDGRGRPAVARVTSSGWLARQQVRLQWGLFLVGLSLRLLLLPLLPVQERRLATQLGVLLPLLSALPVDDPQQRQVAALVQAMPTTVQRQLGQPVQALLAAALPPGVLPQLSPPPVQAVLETLWRDPDPDTAMWVLWVQDQWDPQRAAQLRRTARPGLPTHPQLDALISGRPLPLERRLRQLLRVPLIAALPPAALLTMARSGAERELEPAEPLFRVGESADLVAILVEGHCEVWRVLPSGEHEPVADLGPGDSIGELAFFSQQRRRSEVLAAAGGATLLCFRSHEFETLLLQAPEYSRELSRRLAIRLEALYERLGPADHRRPGG